MRKELEKKYQLQLQCELQRYRELELPMLQLDERTR
jgi:hypothetical protein